MEILKCDLFLAFIECMKSAMTADEQAALFSSAERLHESSLEIRCPVFLCSEWLVSDSEIILQS